MSNNDMKPMSDLEKQVEDEIENARSELTNVVLAKQKEVVLRMGEALEKIRKGETRSSICEELKERLREEIARGIIAKRTVESYCKPQWKNQARSQSGRKGAEKKKNRTESAADSAAELEHDKEQEVDAMIVTTDGTLEPDPASAKDGLTGQLQQPPPTTIHPSAEQEITGDAGVSAKQLGVRNSGRVKFGFWLSFDELHAEMQRRFEEDGAAARVWIGGVIDTSNGNVLSKWVGSDEEEISDEPADGS
jgi:hypothetical protein